MVQTHGDPEKEKLQSELTPDEKEKVAAFQPDTATLDKAREILMQTGIQRIDEHIVEASARILGALGEDRITQMPFGGGLNSNWLMTEGSIQAGIDPSSFHEALLAGMLSGQSFDAKQEVKSIYVGFGPEDIASRWRSDFCKDFDIAPTDLDGKSILDVGANDRKFAAGALCAGANPKELISLDPIYDSARFREQYERDGGVLPKDNRDGLNKILPPDVVKKLDAWTVAGVAQELPFGDNHFDILFFRSSFIDEGEECLQALREIARVLKVGGSAKIYPIAYENGVLLSRGVEKLKLLKENSVELGLEWSLKRQLEYSPSSDRTIQEDLLILTKIK